MVKQQRRGNDSDCGGLGVVELCIADFGILHRV